MWYTCISLYACTAYMCLRASPTHKHPITTPPTHTHTPAHTQGQVLAICRHCPDDAVTTHRHNHTHSSSHSPPRRRLLTQRTNHIPLLVTLSHTPSHAHTLSHTLSHTRTLSHTLPHTPSHPPHTHRTHRCFASTWSMSTTLSPHARLAAGGEGVSE